MQSDRSLYIHIYIFIVQPHETFITNFYRYRLRVIATPAEGVRVSSRSKFAAPIFEIFAINFVINSCREISEY